MRKTDWAVNDLREVITPFTTPVNIANAFNSTVSGIFIPIFFSKKRNVFANSSRENKHKSTFLRFKETLMAINDFIPLSILILNKEMLEKRRSTPRFHIHLYAANIRAVREISNFTVRSTKETMDNLNNSSWYGG